MVAFTGRDDPRLREAALKAGYDGYLPKPTETGVFLAQIAKFVGGS